MQNRPGRNYTCEGKQGSHCVPTVQTQTPPHTHPCKGVAHKEWVTSRVMLERLAAWGQGWATGFKMPGSCYYILLM